MSPRLLLLADDVTGAADCAAYAPALGLPASIYPNALPEATAAGLHAIAMHSRALSPPAAQDAVCAALRGQRDYAATRIFKKIDSLLRGNIGAEVEAMLEMLDAPAALICPALPAQGRSVLNGRLAGAGNGVRIGDVLAAQCALPQARIDLATVRGDLRTLRTQLKAVAAHARLIIPDAESDADLDAVVSAWRTALPDGLLCGSAGLAAAWLRANAPPHAAPLRPAGPIPPIDLVVVGSASSMAHEQIAAAAAQPGAHVAELGRGALPELVPGAWLLLHLPKPAAAPFPQECLESATRLAEAAFAHMQRVPVQHVLVVGGDTAHALCARLALARLDVLRTALSGMPTCAAQRTSGAPLWVTLKAGNHGNADTLAQFVRQ